MRSLRHFFFTIPVMLCLLLPEVCAGQAKSSKDGWEKVADMLYRNFPHHVTFLHHEKDEVNPVDTLYYRYFEPDVKVVQDTLTLSYVVEYKAYEHPTVFEQVLWKVPLNCIMECNIFQFTFGAFDRFDPTLHFWAIVADTDCSMVKKAIYAIDKVDWNNTSPFGERRLLITEDHAYAKFPGLKQPDDEELRLFNQVISEQRSR